jgi:hypothetical protein
MRAVAVIRARAMMLALLVGATAPAAVGRADVPARPDAQTAVFALILGVNRSPDPTLAPLHYADDDAARYLDLFRLLGARTYLLTSPDENTRRLHPQAAAEALPPRRPELDRTLAQLSADIGQARARGFSATLYFIYAGHGNVENQQAYLALEDGRLWAMELTEKVVNGTRADLVHVIVDACHSYFLAFGRGPGGERRPAQGFVALEAQARAGKVGFLLSSSVSGESHEWSGYQAGVFSHEVRSGLYGAADADGDGQVTYREIAAFVERANAAIPNERFRPQVLAQAPARGQVLLDVRRGLDRPLRIDGPARAAHYLLEDARGVRLAEFHGTPGAALRLLRPAPAGLLYLHRLDDGVEFTIPVAPAEISLSALAPEAPRVATRGAAHQAFSLVFSLPFDRAAYDAFDPARVDPLSARARDDRRGLHWSRPLGISAAFAALGLGAVALSQAVSAQHLHDEAPPGISQAQAAAINDRIGRRNLGFAIFAGAAVAAAVTAVTLLVWPEARRDGVGPGFVAGGADGLGVGLRF